MPNLFTGLRKTRRHMAAAAATATAQNWRQHWRERLIMADVGVRLVDAIIEEVESQAAAESKEAILAAVIARRLRPLEAMLATSAQRPCIIIAMGVNGSGKTTTIAKLSRRFRQEEKTVLLAAGDTFRAAAVEQLEKWAAQMGGLDIVGGKGGDPSAVAFEAVRAGIATDKDIVLIDTAGRLPTQKHLMAELAKTRRAINKAMPGAPHELLLILDATTGQNALMQINAFADAVGVTGVIITKLDGSAKGGFLLAMAHTARRLPVRFAGIGESADDLAVFDADAYAAALIGGDEPRATVS